MKIGRNTFIALVAGIMATSSLAAVAQGRQQGQGQGQGQQGTQAQQRQMERAADHERAMEHDRLQTRDRDRTQDRDRIHQVDPDEASGKAIYGGNLMTAHEREQYRERLRAMQTEQERNEYLAKHREQMQLRSTERKVPAEVTSD